MSTRSASRTRYVSPRNSSPLSLSRSEEKQQLETLNNRLAVYIDTVRRLEQENKELKVKFKKFQSFIIIFYLSLDYNFIV